MKRFPILAGCLLAVAPAQAATITEMYGPFTPGTFITDGDSLLTAHLTTITTSMILELTEVQISFELVGSPQGDGFASDIFASLLRSPVGISPSVSDPSAVLLNRVGITGDNPVGFSYDGWSITLTDSAAVDIHGASLISGVLTGTFQPDGRLAPTDATRPSMLGVFNGLAGNGDWRLNVGDFSAGGTMQLVNWSLTLTGEDTISAVPEASTYAAGFGLAALAGGILWRARRRSGL